MENKLIIAIVILLFIVSYLFLYLYFSAKEKALRKELRRALEESVGVQNDSTHIRYELDEKTRSKSTLVYEQVKKIEFLESEVLKHKKRISELKRIAQSATMAQQDFLSNVTEEITRPLEKILKESEHLQSLLKDTHQQSTLKSIILNATTLFTLLKDILNLSKMQAKTFEVDEQITDIHFLLRKLIDKKELLAREKALRLTLEIAEDIPPLLFIDAQKVEEILENLLDNAIAYTQDGYVRLNVLLDELERSSNTVSLSFYVEDTGAGIAQEFQDKVFSAFETLESKEQTHTQALGGLGLAIDKKIALAMGGDITFKSEKAKGSIFRFRLANIEMSLLDASNQSSISSDFSLLKEGRNVVLVAEHNESYETIVQAFGNSNVKCFAYSDFRDATELFTTHKIDMILIDVAILLNDEAAVSKVIASRTKAPVVALVSGRVKEIDFKHSVVKPSGFLQKPLNRYELFKISLRLLNS